MNQPVRKLLVTVLFFHLSASFASCSQVTGKVPQGVGEQFLAEGDNVTVEVWMEGLEIPWSLVFLPDGRALVSERPGRIRLIQEGRLQETPYALIDAAHVGEGGLMGLALHPEFPKKPYVYVMHTYRKGGDLSNRVIRLKHEGRSGSLDRVLIDNIPGGRFHDGGRIAFGPDGMLYITTGEVFEADLAQDITSLGGKILRINPEGAIPPDNPFQGSPVYSYGHRNPQGLAWHPQSRVLFSSEHGPSGESGRFGHDEVNVIVKGGNYGWPKVIGAAGVSSYRDPIIVWKDGAPPAGITFYQGSLLNHLAGDLFVATLRSEALMRIKVDGEGKKVTRIERWFSKKAGEGTYGRIRDVVQGPDGALYFCTSNRDGRGTPRKGDDKIYRIVPKR